MSKPARFFLALILYLTFIGARGYEKPQVYNYKAELRTPPLEVVKIRGGIYMAKGEWGGNVGFYVGNDEVLVIDSKATTVATKRVVKEIRRITKAPITRVIYTHSDPDVFKGHEAYPDKAEVICSLRTLDDWQKNTTVYLEMNAPISIYRSDSTSATTFRGYEISPVSNFLPAITFDGKLNIHIGQEEVDLVHYGPAHTSGDVVVYFPRESVAFIGDLVFVGHEPVIQDQKGGSSSGLIRVLSILLGMKPEIQTFIPSHADPITSREVRQTLEFVEDVRSRVTAMFDAGRTLAEVKKALGVQEPPKEEGAWVWPSLAISVYLELNEKSSNKNEKAKI
jgi:cyclase